MRLFKSKSEPEEQFDEFYASVKLISGEEILCIVIRDKSQPEHIIVDNPVTLQEIRTKGSDVPSGYKLEPWIKLTDETTFLVEQSKIVTVSEIRNQLIIDMYKQLKETGFQEDSHPDVSRKMGYLSSVDEARAILEKLYKSKSK